MTHEDLVQAVLKRRELERASRIIAEQNTSNYSDSDVALKYWLVSAAAAAFTVGAGLLSGLLVLGGSENTDSNTLREAEVGRKFMENWKSQT